MLELMDIDELKAEATALGIDFSGNIGAEKLRNRIEEFYNSQETSGKELQAAVEKQEKKEQSEEKSAETGKSTKRGKMTMRELALKQKEAAMKTHIIIITDNDQKVNNQTTTAIVNCSNTYWDLGTKVIPLNTPVEVMQGFIDALNEITITLHVKDQRTGLSGVRRVKRYNISYEANQPK